MLFPEKMIDFVRTTGPLLAVKALHREKIKQRWQNKNKTNKQKKKKKKKQQHQNKV